VDDDRATYLSQWAISWGRQNGQSETSMTHNIEFVFLPTGCARKLQMARRRNQVRSRLLCILHIRATPPFQSLKCQHDRKEKQGGRSTTG
jgi:hypothetical protein